MHCVAGNARDQSVWPLVWRSVVKFALVLTRLVSMGRVFAALALFFSGVVLAQDSALGVWATEKSEEGVFLKVDVGPCEADAARLCGVVIDRVDSAGASSESEVIGKFLINDMKPVEGKSDAWHKGTIWAPDDDKTYKSKMSLTDEGLKVSGCVFGGLICRSQLWLRDS